MKEQKYRAGFYARVVVSVATLVFCLLFYFSVGYFGNLNLNQEIQEITDEIDENFRYLKLVSDFNPYWAKKLMSHFQVEPNARKLYEKLCGEFARFKLNPQFIVFDQHGRIEGNGHFLTNPDAWEKAAQILQKFCDGNDSSRSNIDWKEFKLSDSDFFILRKLLGNLFFPRNIYLNSNTEAPRLIINEFDSRAKLSWVNFDKNKGLVCLFDRKDLSSEKCILTEIEQLNKKYDGKIIFSIKKGSANIGQKFLQSEKHLVFNKQLNYSSFVSAGVDLKLVSPVDQLFQNRGLIVLLVIFGVMMLYKSIEKYFLSTRPRFSIRSKFVLLFLVSNVLPVLPLFFVAHSYLHTYRNNLVDEIKQNSLKCLRHFDEMYVSEKTRQIDNIRRELKFLGPKLKNEGIQIKSIKDFEDLQDPVPWVTFFVASSSSRMYCGGAIVENGQLGAEQSFDIDEFIERWAVDEQAVENKKAHAEKKLVSAETRQWLIRSFVDRCQAVTYMLQGVMVNLNRQKLEANDQLKLELFFEKTGVSEPEVFVHSFYQALDGIFPIGFGSIDYKNYVTLFSFDDTEKFDYGMLYTFSETNLQQKYFGERFFDFNRNSDGFRVCAVHKFGYVWPEGLLDNQSIAQLINRLSSLSTSELQIVEIEGEKHYARVLKGEVADCLKYVALFPVKNIDEKVKERYSPLLGLWIAVTMISFGFSMFLSRTVTEPVKELKRGVLALKARDFSVRLMKLGNDEFGYLSNFLNRTLNDLEELQVAGFVQEKLLPQMNESLTVGTVKIYGRTVSLNDLGGDYFDVLDIDNRRGIIIGDVAGHGVAASMIMAFVKACVIDLEKLYLDSVEFVNRLNRLFRTTRSKKQRKFMSFQYLLFNQDANFQYVNAGHCFPILIDSVAKTATMLKMINSPLGTSSKDIKDVQNHKLEDGQALVLYSDGYYETGDLGFERFCEILIRSYKPDPKDYFCEINKNINEILGQYQENDDKTMVIITVAIRSAIESTA